MAFPFFVSILNIRHNMCRSLSRRNHVLVLSKFLLGVYVLEPNTHRTSHECSEFLKTGMDNGDNLPVSDESFWFVILLISLYSPHFLLGKQLKLLQRPDIRVYTCPTLITPSIGDRQVLKMILFFVNRSFASQELNFYCRLLYILR